MIRSLASTAPQSVFHWQPTSRHHYRFSDGSDSYGTLSLSLEPSVLFEPAGCEFYRGMAETADSRYSYKCVFKDNEFQGCIAIEERAGRLLAFFENPSSCMIHRRFSWIILPKERVPWLWLPGGEKGRGIVRAGGHRILELHSPAPNAGGTVRIYSPELLNSPDGLALIYFCAYLAIGPSC